MRSVDRKPLAERSKSRSLGYVPEAEIVLLSLFASLVVQGFRCTCHPWVPAVWIETLLLTAVPIILFFVVSRKLSATTETASSDTAAGDVLTSKRTIAWLQGGVLVMALIVGVVQWVSRQTGLGDANEIFALLVVQYAGWYFAVFSKFGTFQRTAFVLSGTIVLFVCFMAETPEIFVFAFFYAIVSLWWLLGNYWNRLNTKAIDAESKTLPVNGLAIGVTVVVLTLIGGLSWIFVPKNASISVVGFSPFSGGEQGDQSDWARLGISDGNMLTSGENATTTGAVDSDQFIEDDKPSIYDITTETYEGPKKITKRENRAVSLDLIAKHLHEVIQSEQAGRTFRTVREPKDTAEVELENRITDALFYAEGSAPARFAVDSFQHFDGYDWTKVDLSEETVNTPGIVIEQAMGKPWYVIQDMPRDYIPVTRGHRIKMMRLRTNSIPATPMLKCWHIHRVEAEGLFYWNDVGLVRMDGAFIPTQTVIDIYSHVPNYHRLRSPGSDMRFDKVVPMWSASNDSEAVVQTRQCSNGTTNRDPAESVYLQVPENEATDRVVNLARQWTRGQPQGWCQVEAIVDRLRSDYVLDPAMVAPDDGTDTVTSFLDQGGGPSYLFATTATQLLRAAGYRTRIASGFVVDEDDYDRVAGQSIIWSENLHMWPEVCLDGWHWIPVEPTPGYPIPYSHQTFWEMTKASLVSLMHWVRLNPISSLLIATSMFAIYWFRRELILGGYWVVWFVVAGTMPRLRLPVTRTLIDARFRLAGMPRPKFEPVAPWFSRVDRETGAEFCRLWQIHNYRTRPIESKNRSDVGAACRAVVSGLSFRKIREFVKRETQGVAT
ncbi:MAG: transglutaminase domain-containing protein [Planctomycetota bacterium]